MNFFGGTIVTLRAFDTPPPGGGLSTVISTVPVMTSCVPLIKDCNSVPLMKTVVRGIPFH